MKVVFDANILVSALVFPGGRGETALQRITEERDELCQSSRISVIAGCLAEREQRPAALAAASLQRFKAHALSADRPVICWAMARW